MTEGVSDTLYIPLAARIYSTENFPEYFRDPASLEFKGTVPKDIVDNSSEYSMLASVARYRNTDRMETEFVQRNGGGCLVHLGVGLETAYLRLSSLDAHFYDMDLPGVVEHRMRMLPTRDNETLISGDLFDMGWAEAVPTGVPVMILVLGVFQYFHEEDVLEVVGKMRDRFPGAELVFDATSNKGLGYSNRYVKKTGNLTAEMHFAVDDALKFAEKSGTELMECRPFFTEARRMLRKKTGLYTRVSMWFSDRYGMVKILHLRLRTSGGD